MNLQLKQVIAAYVIAALVINPAMAQQQSATLMKQQQFRAIAEKLSVDRQSVSSVAIELATTGDNADPALKEALNGTTVVDIAAPSAKGVSKNNWNEFNVGEEGIIFNNSAAPVLTQLGGWADGNRRLAGGEASIILNQVTGSNRSTLLGHIEVAGKSAEFILANANGITCDGCGFINTPSVSLITGQSRFAANGDLTFDISGGDFLLEGDGINATNLDRFDIVSRYAKLNANLYANNVNLTTGVNEFNYQTKVVTTNSSSTNGNIQFAFDTTALGGMYANTIRLIGTEKGLGINLQGVVQSTQDLEITADGNLQLKQLQANKQITAESVSGSVNLEQLIYAPNVKVTAAESITNNGFMAAKDEIRLSAKTINQSGDLYAGLNENNQFNSTGSLTLTASESMINRGDFYIGGQLDLTTPELNNQGVWLMQSAGTLQANTILNSNSIRLNAQDSNLIADSITNSGEILHLGNGLFDANLTGDLDNTGIVGTNGNLKLQADELNNQGQWFANDTALTLNTFNNSNGQFETAALTLNAQTLLNNGGRILSLGNANTTSALTISGNIQNQNGVFYIDTGSFTLTANNLDNTSGNFIINNAASALVNVNSDLNNTAGFFQANQLDITALNLNNTQGDFLTSILDGKFDTLDNASGFIQADQLTLKGHSLVNTGGVVLSGSQSVSTLTLRFSEQLLNNQDAVIRNLNGDIELTTSNFSNTEGLIDASHNGNITLHSTQLNNQQGSLIAKNSLQFSGESVNNTQGYIETGVVDFALTGDLNNAQGVMMGGMELSVRDFNNDQGYVLIDKNSTIDLTGNLLNQLGVIATQDQQSIESFTITANSLQNSGEIIVDAATVNLNVTTTLDNKGLIQNNNKLIQNANTLNITATDLTNTAGAISADIVSLEIGNQFTNTSLLNGDELSQGQVIAGQLHVKTTTAINDLYSLIYAKKIEMTANQLTNNGALVSNHIELTGDQFSNTGNILSADLNSDSLVLNFLTRITNSGQISRNSDWSMTSAQVINNGRIESLGSGVIKAQQIINSDLQKIATQANPATLNVNLDNGWMSAKKLTFTTSNLDNQYGVLLSGEEGLMLSSTDASSIQLNNQNGFVQSAAQNWSLNNIQLNNQNGTLWHSGLGAAEFTLLGNLDNTQGSIISKGNLSLKLNDADSVLINDAGLIQANNLDLVTKKSIENLHQGSLTGKNVILTSNTINNDGGVIEATAQDLALLTLTANQINNTNGGELRSAAKDWNMVLDSVNNDGGNIIHSGTGTLSLSSNTVLENKGNLVSAGNLVVDVMGLNNYGQISANNQLSLRTTGGIINYVEGEIAAGNSTDLRANNQQIDNQGYWYVGQNVTDSSSTSGSHLINSGNLILGDGTQETNINLTLASLTNQGTGAISYNNSGNFIINADNIVNDTRILAVKGGVQVNLTGANTNDGFINNSNILAQRIQFTDNSTSNSLNAFTNKGVLQANQFAFINADLLNTSSATLYGVGEAVFTLQNANIINNGTWINEASNWNLSGTVNGSGNIFHKGDGLFSLALNNDSDLTGAYIETLGSARLENGITGGETTFVDANGQTITRRTTLFSVKDMTLDGSTGFTNAGANLATQQNLLINTGITNTTGSLLKAGGQFSMLNNPALNLINEGDIQANYFSVLVNQFTNTGSLVGSGITADSVTNITASSIDNRNGFIQLDNASVELIATGDIRNQQGVVVNNTSGSVLMNAANMDNQDGYISASRLTLTAANQINNSNSGNTIDQGIFANQLSLKANTLNNTGGVININALAQASYTNLIDVNSLNNQSGLIQLVHVDKNPATLDSLNITATTQIENQSGNIHLQNLQTSGNALINRQGDNHLTVTTAQLTTDNQSQMTSDGTFGLNIQSSDGTKNDLTNLGHLQALNQFTLNAKNLNNQATIASGDNLTLNLDGFNLTNSESIFAKRILSIQAGNIENQNDIFADDNLDITAQGFSKVGALGSGNLLTLNLSSDLTINTNESITAPGALSIITPNFIHNAGTLDSHNQLLLNTGVLTNTATGKIIAGLGVINPDNSVEHSVFTLRNSMDNAGLISVMGYLDINTPVFTNQGSMVVGGYRDANNNLQDFGGVTFDLNPTGETNTGSFINAGNNAVIYVRGDLTLNDANSIVNQQNAQMIARGNAELNGNTLENNQSRIEAFGDLTIKATNSIRNITDEPAITSTFMFERTDGVFVRDEPGTISFRVSSFYEKLTTVEQLSPVPESIIRAGNNLNLLTTNGLIENLYGSIFAGGDLDIVGATLNNPAKVANTIVNTRYFLRWEPTGCQTYCQPTIHEELDPDRPAVTTTTLNSLTGYIHAAGNITGSLSNEVTNSLGSITTAAEKNPETPNNITFTGELNDYINQLLPDELKKSFLTQTEIDTAEKKDASSILAGTLVKPETGTAADGAGTDEQSSSFDGETGTQGSTETDLINQTSNEIAEATEDIPALIAKAKAEQFKTNQWPLISFTVLPFNFNLHNLSGLFVLSQNPNSNYLIETRPEFTDINNLLGSDYLLAALGYDADKTIKRLGDAFFENQLIRDALIKETNSQYIGDVTNDYDLMQMLMDNAVATASSLQLTIGVELTAEQCASLTQDMMWLVKRNVGGQEVLVPHLYLTSVSPEKMAASKSAMAAGGNLSLVTGSLNNQSSMFAGNNLLLSTRGNLQQDGRLYAQGDVRLLAGGTINNTGNVNANNNLLAVAQGDVLNTSAGQFSAAQNLLLQSTQGNVINQQGAINANNLTLDANKNVELTGNLSAQNNLSLKAGEDVVLTSTKVETDFSSKKIKSSSVQYTTTDLAAGGNITLDAGRDIQAEGSDFTAGGDASLRAGNDINLLALQNQSNYEYNAKRKKEIHNTTEHDVVNVNSGGSVSIDAGQDANLTGTNIAANDDVYLSADRDTNITAVVDSDYDYSYSKKKKSFGRSKTRIDETLVENVVGGTIVAGGNVMVNALADEEGNLALTGGRDVNLNGAVIASENGDVVLAATDDVNVGTVEVNSIDYHLRKKSGTGGITGKSKSSTHNSTEQIGTQIQSGNDAVILAGNDANLVSAAVIAKNDIQLEAGLVNEAGDINLLTADNTYLDEEKKSKKSMSLKINKEGVTFDKTTKHANDNTETYRMGNLLSAGCNEGGICSGDVNLSAARDVNVVGSTVSGNSITADAGRDVNLLASQDDVNSGQERSVSRNGISWSSDKNGVTVFAGEETNRDRLETRDKVSISTSLNSTENTNLTAGRDINLAGSDINSEKSITLDAKRNVTIGTSNESYQSINEHENIKDGLTVTANHNLGNLGESFESLGDLVDGKGNAISDASTGMRALDAINNSTPSASAHLGRTSITEKQTDTNQIAFGSRLNAKEDVNIAAGETATVHGSEVNAKRNITVDATDINIIASENTTDSKSKNGYHKTGIDLQGGKGNVSLTGGFTLSSSEMTNKDITANASQLNGENISLIARNDVNVKGSDLNADKNIAIEAGRDVNITSAEEYTRSEFDSEYKSANAGVNFGSDGIGFTANGSIGEEELDRNNITHRNSTINAKESLTITSGNDTTIKGANVSGKDVDVTVGNNLTIASEQDTGKVKGHRFDASGSVTVGAGVSGSVSLGYGETEGSSAWVANQTSLTGSNSINVNVKNHTQLDGAVMGNIKEDENGNKTDGDVHGCTNAASAGCAGAANNFNLTTKTFGFTNLQDHHEETSTYVGVSIGGGGESAQDAKVDSYGIDAQYSDLDKKQISYATLGNGNINIQQDSETGQNSVAAINRDLTASQDITKNESTNIDVYVQSDTIETLTDESKRNQLIDRMTNPGRLVGEAFQFAEITNNIDDAFSIIGNGEIKAPTKDQLSGMTPEQQNNAWADYYDQKNNQGIINASSAKQFDNKVLDFSIATQQTIISQNHEGGINFLGLGEDNNLIQNYERNQFSRVTTTDARANAANQFQYETIDGQVKDGVDVLNNATAYSVDTNQFVAQLFVDGMSGSTDIDALLYSNAPASGMAGYGKGVAVTNEETNTKIAGVNVDKTNLTNVNDYIATLSEETYHNMNPEDHQANLFADHSARLWNDANVSEGRKTDEGVGINQWREDNKNDATIAKNNVTIGSQRARDMEFRQLQLPELKYIKDNAKLYAVEQGITEEEARKELTQQALLMTDKTWAEQDHIQENDDARDFLIRYTAGQEFDILTENGIEKTGMFTPTESQFNDFELGQNQARLLDDPNINSNVKPTTEFENWITTYGTENGSSFNLKANIPGEVSGDISETTTGILGYVDEYGWGAVPQFTADLWNGAVGSLKTTYDNWQTSGAHALIPDSQSTGSNLDNAYFANLIGDQKSFDDGMAGNALSATGGLSAGAGGSPFFVTRNGLPGASPDVDLFDDSEFTINIYGFRGAGDSISSPGIEHPYQYTGHVGYSFDNGETIWGFGPDYGEESLDQVMKNLKDHGSYPGQLTPDNYVFDLVNEKKLFDRNGDVQSIFEWKIPVSQEQFDLTLLKHNELVSRGSLDDVRYQWYIDPMPCNSYNCATFPAHLNLPIPEDTGILKYYINELEKRGTRWKKTE